MSSRRSAAETFEKVHTLVFPHSAAAAAALAQEVKQIIEARTKAGKPAVLGMATGESLACLNYLLHRGEAKIELDETGVARYQMR